MVSSDVSFHSRRKRSPQTVTSKINTSASKSVYQARSRTVAFSKKFVAWDFSLDVQDPTVETEFNMALIAFFIYYGPAPVIYQAPAPVAYPKILALVIYQEMTPVMYHEIVSIKYFSLPGRSRCGDRIEHSFSRAQNITRDVSRNLFGLPGKFRSTSRIRRLGPSFDMTVPQHRKTFVVYQKIDSGCLGCFDGRQRSDG